MDKVCLLTIWHTGTNYFGNGLRQEYDLDSQHLNRPFSDYSKYSKVFTSYRDPYRAAASWINRGLFKDNPEVMYAEWIKQWNAFEIAVSNGAIVLDLDLGREQQGLIFPKKALNSYRDRLGCHKELDEGNKEYLHRFIPEYLLDLATAKSKVYTDR